MSQDLPAPVPPTGNTPSSDAPSNTSSGLSRTAIERVLARAAELHNAQGFEDPADTMSETHLLEIAREVGLSETSVRQALAEERTRVGTEPAENEGWVTRITGPGVVSAVRAVRGTPAEIMAALDAWMQREECLQVQRRFADRVVWEARSDWFNALRRGLRLGGRNYQLCRARQVGATVIPIDDTRVLVRLDADITPKRVVQVRLGAVAGAGGVALSGSLVVLGTIVHAALIPVIGAALIPVGVGGVAAYAAMRRHQQLVQHVLLALEQALDRLEFADTRKSPTLLDVVATIRPLVR